jgi:hypothetical protein
MWAPMLRGIGLRVCCKLLLYRRCFSITERLRFCIQVYLRDISKCVPDETSESVVNKNKQTNIEAVQKDNRKRYRLQTKSRVTT